MMVISYKIGPTPIDDEWEEKSWSVGESMPPIPHSRVEIVEADGEELRFILQNLANLPHLPGACRQVWYGDHAKFISGNLGEIA